MTPLLIDVLSRDRASLEREDIQAALGARATRAQGARGFVRTSGDFALAWVECSSIECRISAGLAPEHEELAARATMPIAGSPKTHAGAGGARVDGFAELDIDGDDGLELLVAYTAYNDNVWTSYLTVLHPQTLYAELTLRTDEHPDASARSEPCRARVHRGDLDCDGSPDIELRRTCGSSPPKTEILHYLHRTDDGDYELKRPAVKSGAWSGGAL